MSSTTTPAKARTLARPCRSAASTIKATTSSSRRTRASSGIAPAAATRWTCRTPEFCSSFLDSLRHWVEAYHVDGFPLRSRPCAGTRALSTCRTAPASFQAIMQDPVLSRVKLIAEPWDLGVGRLPRRRLSRPAGAIGTTNSATRSAPSWRGDEGQLPRFASRLTGSSDIFDHSGRRPWASVQYVASHDGFTLEDVVSYTERHNLANGREQQGRAMSRTTRRISA